MHDNRIILRHLCNTNFELIWIGRKGNWSTIITQDQRDQPTNNYKQVLIWNDFGGNSVSENFGQTRTHPVTYQVQMTSNGNLDNRKLTDETETRKLYQFYLLQEKLLSLLFPVQILDKTTV